MIHLLSRYPPYDAFAHADGRGLKFGDTYRQPRFNNPAVVLQSPVAGRYGGRIYDFVHSEFFLCGNATRVVRVVTEVAASWAAALLVARTGFAHSVAPGRYCGEEGYYGESSLAVADSTLRGVFDALRSPAFQGVLGGACGIRSGVGAWQRFP